MNTNRAVLLAVVSTCTLLALPSIIQAQQIPGRPMGAVSPAAPARISRPVAMRPAPAVRSAVPMRRAPSTGIRVNRATNFSRASTGASAMNSTAPQDNFGFENNNSGFIGAPLSLQDLLNITPTNGFDWQHVNAINQDLPQKALIDPVTQLEIAQAERLLRASSGTFSGAFVLGGGYGYYVPEQMTEEQQPYSNEQAAQAAAQTSASNAEPRVIVLQQAAPQKSAAPSAPRESPEQAVPDRGEFTLVLRNGEHIKALAFTHVKDKIIYITPDGNRKTIDAGDLDPDATVRLNQEKGSPLQLPL